MIALKQTADGVILPVRVRAGARADEVRGEHAGMLKVTVRQAPEKGKANQAIVALLAKKLNYHKYEVELVSGATNSQKAFLIRGAAKEDLAGRISDLL
ncbi:MAG: DUF167 domain-containing protein [bacterium]|nr:DUF167 domain-containing protein [bacterium]